MSSRIIVKNLPKNVTEKQLRETFVTKGCITDLQLKYTKNGTFRQFAFVGFKTEEEALAAKEYFHDTYVNAAKIKVEICANLGDENKPKAWSKHSREKSLPVQDVAKDSNADIKSEDKKKKNEKNTDEFLKELEKDVKFTEFLALNRDRREKPLWADDVPITKDSEETSGSDAEDSGVEAESSENDEACLAKKKDVSDLDYLKSKMTVSAEDTAKTTEDASEATEKLKKVNKMKTKKKNKEGFNDLFTVKIRNLPFRCKKKQIKQFFQPLKPVSLRIPPRFSGFAYVKFKTEKDLNRALIKHKGFLDGHRIDVVKYEKKTIESDEEKNAEEDKEKEAEMLAESGRLFVRNLCYDVSEEELKKLFSKYGQLVEINLPIDSYSKKGQGFAFITYLFAEHAVKAFAELDGTIFQGRLLHLVPGKPKREVIIADSKDESFKKKKETKLKALSGSSHNWNTLFLGLNAVADSLAKRYNIKKNDLLNDEREENIAVRMALGETQLVIETREFLLRNGVSLDAFSQAASERSKTVIIAKNLPSDTSSYEINELFSKHGIVARVVIPPSGVTAVIEFQQAVEAKSAFQKLAYSRFHHLPLYLEWAPMNVFTTTATEQLEITKKEAEAAATKAPSENVQEETVSEAGSTLFIKNINFSTNEDTLRNHFKRCGPILSVSLSKKKDIKTGKVLSMGFGFIQFKKKSSALTAIQDLQASELEGHKLVIKFSTRATLAKADTERKKMNVREQDTSKILVRNVPFEVSEKEVRALFKEFGNLKSVRLPKKPEGSHRGFAFVDYSTKENAKRAFDALCHSTHLLGRRLVLEWANPDSENVAELRKRTAENYTTDAPQTMVKKSKLMDDVMLASSQNVV